LALIHQHMKQIMKRDFPGYKRIQVAATLNKIEILQKTVISEKRIFGILFNRKFEYEKKTIFLEEFTIAYNCHYIIKRNRNQMFVAIDESNKTVYWNYMSLPDEY
jgi:hypothetical protein